MTLKEIDLLVLSTADWNRPLWTNKQHLTVELAKYLPRVIYVNSMALRRPKATTSDIRRVLERLTSTPGRTVEADDVPKNVTLVTPYVAPFHRDGTTWYRFNRWSLHRSLDAWIGSSLRKVLWTFTPVTYDLELVADVCVYHSVDLLHEFPGVDRKAILAGEKRLLSEGVEAVASSSVVADHLARVGFKEVRTWPNVAQTQLLSSASQNAERSAFNVVFAGNLTQIKVDLGLLHAVLDDQRMVLHLAGPLAEGGGDSSGFSALMRHPRVRYHGTLELRELGRLFGSCTVGLIPYRRSAYTDGVFPMKVYEYLTSGLAVISSDLPALRQIEGVNTTDTAASFASVVSQLATMPSEKVVAARRELAREHSWEARGLAAIDVIESTLGRTTGS